MQPREERAAGEGGSAHRQMLCSGYSPKALTALAAAGWRRRMSSMISIVAVGFSHTTCSG